MSNFFCMVYLVKDAELYHELLSQDALMLYNYNAVAFLTGIAFKTVFLSLILFFRSCSRCTLAIFCAEPRRRRISTAIGAKAVPHNVPV